MGEVETASLQQAIADEDGDGTLDFKEFCAFIREREEGEFTEEELRERTRWRLESEKAAIDRYLDSLGAQLGGAGSSGPGTEALSSKGLVALAAARRQAEAAAAAAAEADGAP